MYGYTFIVQNESRNLWDCECSLGEIYETNRNDVSNISSTFWAEVFLIIVLFCLLMLMISIKAILTLNATSMDLIPVYIFCMFNISTFWYMHHAKTLLVLTVSSLNVAYCVCHELWHGIFSIRIDSDQIYGYVFREFATRHFIEDLLTFRI